MGFTATDSVAVLDALAPPLGYETEVALLSTYSVDLVAVAAIVVALAGEGDDHEKLDRAALAKAAKRMRDRFRVVCQAGRVAKPRQGTAGLALADRWVREVHFDGNQRSWHAKLGLVRYRKVGSAEGTEQPETLWRLWMGSRNLTCDTSWDSALVALGGPGKVRAVDRSVADAAAVLAERAALPDWDRDRIQDALKGVHWTWPSALGEVKEFSLWTSKEQAPGLPSPPPDTRRILVVSPFIDARTIEVSSAWGNPTTQRRLLTTATTLSTLAGAAGGALKRFASLHTLDDALDADDGSVEPDDPGEDQDQEVHRGLHAKLLVATSEHESHLWLGSANLTARGWSGANVEVMVHSRTGVRTDGPGDQLERFVEERSLLMDPSSLALHTVAPSPAEQELDALRNRISAEWADAKLQRFDTRRHLILSLPASPLRPADQASLRVRLLGTGRYADWPTGSLEIRLPAVARHELTEFVELELSSTAQKGTSRCWVSRAAMDPPPGDERDWAVLARLMGPRALLSWLRALVDGADGRIDTDPWPERQPRGATRGIGAHGTTGSLGAPSLEVILRAWTRDPAKLSEIDRTVRIWLAEVRGANADSEEPDDQEAWRELVAFEKAWAVLRQGLGFKGEPV